MAEGQGEILVYSNASGEVQLDVRLQDETVWLTQQRMAELFGTSKQNISHHVKCIYSEEELERSATVKKFLTVQKEGSRVVERQLEHYNLDMIISVGYRVKSKLATHFRIWATQRLREYLIKGFVMNDDRLKNPPTPAHGALPDYFDELLGRIRDIRASERRMYLRVRDIFAMAADYAPSEADTQGFFSRIQNKLHFAVTGLTAAEIIAQRADGNAQNMG
ncbi:MAG: RhuM family protein, partial [Bacteroidota bacterium]